MQQVQPADNSRDANAAPANLFRGFSGYSRPITTQSQEAQRWFDQGIQLLYGFNHDEAIRSFEMASKVDPSCAMGWWGSAYARGLHINNPQMTEGQSQLAYRADLGRHPNNAWSLLGLQQSLGLQGQSQAAEDLNERVQQAWARADVKPIASCYCHPDALVSP